MRDDSLTHVASQHQQSRIIVREHGMNEVMRGVVREGVVVVDG